jgi:hypothetical protein
MLRRAQYLLIALFGMWAIALSCPRTGLATTIIQTITVTNPSFEISDPLTSGSADTGLYNFTIEGWNTTGSDGTWQPNLSHTPQYFTTPQIPDGTNVAFSNGGVIYQTLSVTLAAADTYTLTVYVGHRNGVWPTVTFPNLPYYIGIFTGDTFTGTNVLVADYEPVSEGQWKAVTLTYTPTSGDPIGEHLGIFLYSAGTQVDFDKVSLTRSFEVVPIPGSVFLLGTGLLGLGLPCFRRKKIS